MSTAVEMNADCRPVQDYRPLLPSPEARWAAPAPGLLGFVVFLLLNAVLFIRPSDLFDGVKNWPLYTICILACAVLSLPAILERFGAPDKLLKPIYACFFGLYVAVWMSHLSRLHLGDAWDAGYDFTKVAVYFVLLVSLVNTYGRLRVFLLWLIACVVVLAALALLQYHGKINLPALEVVEETGNYDEATGEYVLFRRLVSTGLYHDPNDLCLILVVGMAFSLYWLEERPVGPARFLALAPLGLFGYALALTQSRGGFLALVAGLLALLSARFGWRKTALLLPLALPLMIFLFAGRQTHIDLSNSQDTAQGRIQLWREGLQLYKTSPLFGIGTNGMADEIGTVAHNTFVHTYTELGFFGGTWFTSLTALGVWLLLRRRGPAPPVPPPELRVRPYLLAAVVAYAAGMFSLSRGYIPPTYLPVGLVAAYGELPAVQGHLRSLALTPRLLVKLVLVSLGTLLGLYAITRLVPPV
jgi:hypothetical protein